MDNSDDYYELLSNRIFVRGHNDPKAEEVKWLSYPNVFSSAYTISKDGYVYSVSDDKYIEWDLSGDEPSVTLLSKNFSFEKFLIKDLVAYSYIADASNYLERGYKIINKNGNLRDCNYRNIMFYK